MKKLLTLLTCLFSASGVFAQYNMCLGDFQELCPGENVTISTCLNQNLIDSLSIDSAVILDNMQQLSQIDDIYSFPINIGFPFTFYGNTHTQLVISSNGYLSFNLAYAGGYSPWQLFTPAPSAGLPLDAIYGPYQDVDPSVGGVIQYGTSGVSPNQIFVVRFLQIPMYSFACNQLKFCGAIILHENTNKVEVYIKDKQVCPSWNGGTAIEGLMNASGTVADIVPGRNFPTQWTATDDAYEFVPNGANYAVNSIPYKKIIYPNSPLDSAYVADSLRWSSTEGDLVGYGLTYTFNPATYPFLPLPANDSIGFYPMLPYHDTLNCNGDGLWPLQPIAWVHVKPNPQPILLAQNINCQHPTGSILIVNAPFDTYQWNDPMNQNTPLAVNLNVGVYTVFVTLNGCPGAATAQVIDETFSIQISVSPDTCNTHSGTAMVSVTGVTFPYSYQWDAASGNQTGSAAVNLNGGNYSVTVTDISGCSVSATTTVPSTGSNPPTVLSPVNYCINDAALALSANGTNLIFYDAPNGGNVLPQPVIPSTSTAGVQSYWVTQNPNGCESQRVEITVIVHPLPSPLSVFYTDSACSPATLNLSASSGDVNLNIQWTVSGGSILSGDQTFNPTMNWSSGGNYSFTAQYTDTITGCSNTQSFAMHVLDAPVNTIAATDTAFCDGGGVEVYVLPSGSGSVLWSTGAGTDSISVNQGGLYWVLSELNGCWSDTAFIQINSLPYIYPLIAEADTAIHSGETVQLNVSNTSGNNSLTYIWIPANELSCSLCDNPIASPSVSSVYYVTIDYPCTGSDSISISLLSSRIEIPNAFSPNDDGKNDRFMPLMDPGNHLNAFRIFNRWGQMIFNGESTSWDGSYKNEPQPVGSYIYYINISTEKGDEVFEGSISLIR